MISFFIVGIVLSTDNSAQMPQPDVFRPKIFSNCFDLVFDARSQFLRPRPLPLRFQDALLQSPGARRTLTAQLFTACNISPALGVPAAFQRCDQSFARQLAIEGLRTGVLNGHADSGGQMTQRHSRGHLVYILPARPAGTRKSFLKIRLPQFHQTNLPTWRAQPTAAEFSHGRGAGPATSRLVHSGISRGGRHIFRPSDFPSRRTHRAPC
jgi:hypothetical protein